MFEFLSGLWALKDLLRSTAAPVSATWNSRLRIELRNRRNSIGSGPRQIAARGITTGARSFAHLKFGAFDVNLKRHTGTCYA